MRFRLDVSPAALLLFSLIYFFDSTGTTSLIVPAAAVHELGHLAVLRFFKVNITRIRLTVTGLVIDSMGNPSTRLFCIMSTSSGPLAGFVLALICSCFSSEYIRLCGAVSFWLSVLNLLPAYPLDGGRLLSGLVPTVSFAKVSLITSAILLAAGIVIFFALSAIVPMLFGLWLVLVNIKSGIVD